MCVPNDATNHEIAAHPSVNIHLLEWHPSQKGRNFTTMFHTGRQILGVKRKPIPCSMCCYSAPHWEPWSA